jgi:ankyrin repeat protein
MTALMVAADKGFLGMVTALLNAGALVNLANQQGINALTLAQGEKKNPAVLELLTKASEHEKQETAKKLAHEAEEAKKNEGTPPGAAA